MRRLGGGAASSHSVTNSATRARSRIMACLQKKRARVGPAPDVFSVAIWLGTRQAAALFFAGSGRMTTVSATGKIWSPGMPTRRACSRIDSGSRAS